MSNDNDDLWANLPSDLLYQIVQYLHSYDDYVRLRLVCKSWSLSLAKTPEHKYPWLVFLPYESSSIETHAPRDKEINQMKLSQMQKHLLRGSCYGFLVILGLLDGALYLLNPFTKVRFDLPPISTLPDIIAYLPENIGEEYIIRVDNASDVKEACVGQVVMNRVLVYKIIISSPPDRDPYDDFMAVIIYGCNCRLGFCRSGDSGWTDIPTTEKHAWEYEDVIFMEGKIYAVDCWGRLYEFDMHTKPIPLGGVTKVKPPVGVPQTRGPIDWPYRYLAVHGNGRLLMAVRNFVFSRNGEPYGYRTDSFTIYMLTNNEWSKLYNLGNYALVLGFNSSIAVMPHTSSYAKPNRIYYTDNLLEFHYLRFGDDDLESSSSDDDLESSSSNDDLEPNLSDDDLESNSSDDGLESLPSTFIGGHDIGVFDLTDGSNSKLFPAAKILLPPPIWLC